MQLKPGSIVTMITPFGADGKIDYAAVERLVEWYLASGCAGIFSPCLSSEMFDLSADERLELAAAVRRCVAGRAAVVSTGTYGGPIEDQAAFVKKISQHCDAVVVNTAALTAEGEDDVAWQRAASELLRLTGDVELGLYECPVPYKRLLSPDLMRWCAESGRFSFHKDTCCNTADIQAKLDAVAAAGTKGARFRFYNANVETLLPSLRLGGHGFSGISANFYPHLHAWLCAAAVDPGAHGASEAALQKVQDFLSLAEATVCVHYPCSAKTYLRHAPYPEHANRSGDRSDAGRIRSACRVRGLDEPLFLEHQHAALAAMWRLQRALSEELAIACPAMPFEQPAGEASGQKRPRT